eukprot:c21061_g1_i1 orf=53-1411(+)
MPAAQGKTSPLSLSPQLTEGSEAAHSDDRREEYVSVNLSDIRKDVQCSICLGIIRKTRTVMECLHRFCRECIDKSMRLGNNECPVCRTHCASRRSLRDDLNFDALIAVLYPDVDSYEEEELALRDEDKRLNSQLQASIAETSLRQSDAIARRCTTAKATAAAIVRKAHSKLRNIQNRNRSRSSGQDHGYSYSYEDDNDLWNLTQHGQASPMGGQQRERRIWKRKRRTSNFVLDNSLQEEATDDEQDQFEQDKAPHLGGNRFDNDDGRENSVAEAGKRDGIVTWARAGARSHMRYGSLMSNTNNRHIQCMRSTALLESLAAARRKENNSEFVVHFTLLPFGPSKNEEKIPSLEKPYLCCPASVTAHHICKFLASRLSLESTRELELLVGSPSEQLELITESKCFQRLKRKTWPTGVENCKATEILHPQATLGQIHKYFWDFCGNLVLMYRYKA